MSPGLFQSGTDMIQDRGYLGVKRREGGGKSSG